MPKTIHTMDTLEQQQTLTKRKHTQEDEDKPDKILNRYIPIHN